MRLSRIMSLAAGAVVAAASAVCAQGPVLKWSQRWTPRLPAFESRVISCVNPTPAAAWMIALDDWICPQTGPIIRVDWWGTVTATAQLTRPYWIAIYRDNGNCQPVLTNRLLGGCVVPDKFKYVGLDCQNRRVFFFSARLPTVFTQIQGEHYWLQISEADQESIQPGIENFRWSAHRPIMVCPAVQAFPLGPLPPDPCLGGPDDLAFRLRARNIMGTVFWLNAPLVTATSGVLHLRVPGSPDVVEMVDCEFVPDPAGMGWSFLADPESPPGMYDLELDLGGVSQAMRPRWLGVDLSLGAEIMLPPTAICNPDYDGDNRMTSADITGALNAWFASLANGCP